MWSFNEEDPSNGADGRFERHNFQGSRSLNLLGGLIDPPADPPGTESFAIEVNNVSQLKIMAHSNYNNSKSILFVA